MRIKSLSFRNVGPFGEAGVRLDGFTSGLNVICETNEFGKSTVLKALEIVLFKPFSSLHQDVKALRTTNSEGAPEGEITFSDAGKDYRLYKRFLKSKCARLEDARTGEVLAIDREAEEMIAKLLRSDRFEGGPSGLLWVRQGKSMTGISDNGQVASRLEGELGTLIGGERARQYLARVETELAAVLTRGGQEKKGGALRNAREAVAATEAELAEAKRQRDLTASIGAELRRVADDIDRLSQQAEDESLSEQIESTREAMDAARHFADALALLEAQHDQALAASERAAIRQSDYISALVNFNETVSQLAEAEAAHAAKKEALKEANAAYKTQRKNVNEIETRFESVSRLRTQREMVARQTQRLKTLQKDMQHSQAVLDQLTTLEDERASVTVQLAELPVVARADVEILRGAANELRQIESELAAFSTHLYLDLFDEARGKVVLDGAPLKTGPIELSGGASLSISGIGTLRNDDSHLRDTRRNLEKAREDYAALLKRLKVDDTAEASKFADQRQSLEAERKRVTADMARLAPEGRNAVENNFINSETEARELADSLQDNINELGEKEETDTLETLRAERAKLEVIAEVLKTAEKILAASETDQARLRERLSGLNLPDGDAARKKRAETYAGEKIKADADVKAFKMQVETLKLQTPDQSLDMLTARFKRLNQVWEQTRHRLEMLKTKAAGLKARRDSAFEGEDSDGVVDALEGRLAVQQHNLARQIRAKDVRVLLRETLVETQTRLQEAYTAPVTHELAPLISRVMPGAEAGLGDTLGVDTVRRNGTLEKIGQLSGGTREQFAILTRLAYARLLARSGASAPVILDDALVYADDTRRDAMYDVLGLVSSGEMPIQIVYLSCHADATRNLGGTRITPQPW